MELGLTLLLPVTQVGYGAFCPHNLHFCYVRGPDSQGSGRGPLSGQASAQFPELEAVIATWPHWAPHACKPSSK